MRKDKNTITISFPPELLKKVEEMAQETGKTESEVVCQAILRENYLRNEISRGNKLLIQRNNDSIRELVFR